MAWGASEKASEAAADFYKKTATNYASAIRALCKYVELGKVQCLSDAKANLYSGLIQMVSKLSYSRASNAISGLAAFVTWQPVLDGPLIVKLRRKIERKVKAEKADRPPTPASPLWVSNTFQNKKTLFTVSYEAIRRDVSDFLASIPFLSGKGFMGHSLRGAVGSWLAECGVPIFAILSRGGWTSLSTFLRVYCRSLGNVNFTEILM